MISPQKSFQSTPGGYRALSMVTGRHLQRDEIEKVWSIDRSEVIENIYTLEGGSLILRPEYFDMRSWPPGEAEKYTPFLVDCFDRGGWFFGLFDGGGLVGAAILESKLIGPKKDTLQLKFLHVSREYRKQGLGRQLFELAKEIAAKKGARRLYISATPSENTINFYLRLGCWVTSDPDPELFALEPEDIHLECEV